MKHAGKMIRGCVCLAVIVLAGCRGEGKFEERTLGYTGEARRDPFLALGKLLESWDGYAPEYVPTLKLSTDDYGTVLVRRETLNDAVQVETVRELMEGGTHVIVLMSGGEVYINDWREEDWGFPGVGIDQFEKSPLSDLFDEAGIEVGEESDFSVGSDVRKIRFVGEEFEVEMPGAWELGYVDGEGDVELVDDENAGGGLPLVSTEYAMGRLTVVASAKPFRNRFIADHDHAALYHALWDESQYYGTAIVKGKGISFFTLVWDRAWMVVIAVGAWLVLWLWFMLMRRSMPVESLPPALTSYRDRIENLANFMWKRGAADSLVDSIKRSLVDRWRILTGENIEYPEMPDPAKVAERLEGEISAEKIDKAFSLSRYNDDREVQQSIEVLQAIHHEL